MVFTYNYYYNKSFFSILQDVFSTFTVTKYLYFLVPEQCYSLWSLRALHNQTNKQTKKPPRVPKERHNAWFQTILFYQFKVLGCSETTALVIFDAKDKLNSPSMHLLCQPIRFRLLLLPPVSGADCVQLETVNTICLDFDFKCI